MKTQAKYTDKELIDRILNHDSVLFELIIRRYNQCLFRIGRMYRFSHEDTQDLMQEAYIKTYRNLAQFEGNSSFKTWISKIMVNECYRKSKRCTTGIFESLENNVLLYERESTAETSHDVMNTELNSIIEKSLLQIPLPYRTVFMMREINGLSVSETAEVLEISESNVKVRLNRAKSFLKIEIGKFYNKEEIFDFNLIYCDDMVNRVMSKIASM